MKLPKGMTIYGQNGRQYKDDCPEDVFKGLKKKTQDKIKEKLKEEESPALEKEPVKGKK